MPAKKYYIAYGSNLSVAQMKLRCPDAKIVGKAVLHEWKLEFKVHASITQCPGKEVPVVIWEISERDERNLDYYEGYPKYYSKHYMTLVMTSLKGDNPKHIIGMAYIMTDIRSELSPPSYEYMHIIEEGYLMFGFDTSILDEAVLESL